ncbi:Uncharacterized protein OBRU01_22231 [Operophtera brumata]|uniref:Envelope fusion protein n=1 Tax=Operophtera brumata TaxID=104452 RepID=A0A0L7KJR6_OPEBR|nr:Uncharacterized protein OBRU01_22231 [Operophtera brumata]
MKDNILVTTSIITSYNKTLNKIKINEVNLNEAIDKLSHKLQNISELTNGLHVLSNINEILDSLETSILTLSFQLEDVTNAILFSSQNILHPAVITPQQLYRELADNYRHLPNYLELPIILDINTIHHILSVSKLICYYVDYKIIFVLQVPLVGIREYMLFHNIALPTPYNVKEPNKFSLIIPSSKYIAMTKDKSHYCNLDDLSNCKTVKPGNFICDITSVYVADSKPTCESELLTKVISEIPKQCETKFIFGELDIWKPLINNKWIFIQSKPNKISIDCANSKIYETTILATGILNIPNNCIGYCKSTTLFPRNNVLNITSPVNNIPDFNLINDSCCNIIKFNNLIDDVSPIKLQNVDLDEFNSRNKIVLKSLLENLEKIENSPHIIKYGTHYSSLIILILAVIMMYLGYLIFKYFCKPGNNRISNFRFRFSNTSPQPTLEMTRTTDRPESDIESSHTAILEAKSK